jgi:hypothetical protein
MNLAAILGVCLLSAGWMPTAVRGLVPQTAGQPPATTSSDSSAQQSQGDSTSQPQATPSQSAQPTQPLPAPTSQTPNSPGQAKPSSNRPRHHKKTVPPDCSNAPAALNTTGSNPPASSNSSDAGSSNAGSTNAGSSSAGSSSANSTALPPCPPPKKVVRNGGSTEPSIQLVGGGTTAEQAVHQRSTDQLIAATQENLKKIEGRQLSPSQQEMVNQIKQFMEQSKTAVAAGDLERGNNLALKAHLLSDELVKP